MKIYYMTQASIRPPTFVVFTDKADKMHFSAERFLVNRLRDDVERSAKRIAKLEQKLEQTLEQQRAQRPTTDS